MPGKNAGSLHVDLTASTARLRKGMLKATASVKKYKRAAVRDLAAVRGAVTGLTGRVVALAGAGGLGLLVQSSFKTTDALAKTADKLGITTEALAGLRHAASITGVDQAVFDKGLQNMVRTLRDANNGLATYKRSYDELGLNVQKLQQLSPEQQFATIAEALKNVTNKTRKLGIAYDIFGGRATALINTLNLGKEGIEGLTQEARDFGLAVSRVEAKKIENANDAFTRVGAIVRGLGTAIATRLAPWLEHIAKLFIKNTREAGGMGKVVDRAFASILEAIKPVAKAIDILNIGWNTMKTGVLAVAAGVAKVAAFLGSDLGAQMAMDFEAATITSAMRVQDLVATIGQSGEQVKETLRSVTEAANQDAAQQVSGAPGGGDTATANEALIETEQQKWERLRLMGDAFRAADEQAAIEHQQKMVDILAKGGAAQVNIDRLTGKQKLQLAKGWLQGITGTLVTGSKKAFRINKALALADAAVNIPSAVIKSFNAAGGYPLGLIPASIMALKGAQQIRAIKATSFGGGGNPPSVGGGGAGANPVGTGFSGNVLPGDIGIDGVPQATQKRETKQVNITIDGDALLDSNGVRKLIEKINDEAGDMNLQVVIA